MGFGSNGDESEEVSSLDEGSEETIGRRGFVKGVLGGATVGAGFSWAALEALSGDSDDEREPDIAFFGDTEDLNKIEQRISEETGEEVEVYSEDDMVYLATEGDVNEVPLGVSDGSPTIDIGNVHFSDGEVVSNEDSVAFAMGDEVDVVEIDGLASLTDKYLIDADVGGQVELGNYELVIEELEEDYAEVAIDNWDVSFKIQDGQSRNIFDGELRYEDEELAYEETTEGIVNGGLEIVNVTYGDGGIEIDGEEHKAILRKNGGLEVERVVGYLEG